MVFWPSPKKKMPYQPRPSDRRARLPHGAVGDDIDSFDNIDADELRAMDSLDVRQKTQEQERASAYTAQLEAANARLGADNAQLLARVAELEIALRRADSELARLRPMI